MDPGNDDIFANLGFSLVDNVELEYPVAAAPKRGRGRPHKDVAEVDLHVPHLDVAYTPIHIAPAPLDARAKLAARAQVARNAIKRPAAALEPEQPKIARPTIRQQHRRQYQDTHGTSSLSLAPLLQKCQGLYHSARIMLTESKPIRSH